MARIHGPSPSVFHHCLDGRRVNMPSRNMSSGSMRDLAALYQAKIDKKVPVFMSASYDYGPRVPSYNEGDLVLSIGDIVEVTDSKLDDSGGWWAGINMRTKDAGVFPANFVEEATPKDVQRFMASADGRTNMLRAPTNVVRPSAASTVRAQSKNKKGERLSAIQSKASPKVFKVPVSETTVKVIVTENDKAAARGKKKPAEASARPVPSSRTRVGVFATNVTIYASFLWGMLGFAHLLSAANEVSPWLHECWQELEPTNAGGRRLVNASVTTPTKFVESGCRRPYGPVDVWVSIYSVVAAVCLATYLNTRGWARDGTLVKPLAQIVAILAVCAPGVLTMPTLFGVIFVAVGQILAIVATICLREVYTPNPRNPKDVRICPPRNVLDLCTCAYRPASTEMSKFQTVLQCLSGKVNPEGRNGRVFFLGLYVVLNLSLGVTWFVQAHARILDNTYPMTIWVCWAKFFGVMMDLNFTLIFVPVSRVAVLGKAYRAATRSALDQNKGCSCASIVNFVPLDYALEFHMLCGYVGYACAVIHTFCHVMNYQIKAQAVWEAYGISIWITGIISLLVLTLLVAAAHQNIRRSYFAIFWGAHMLGFSGVTLMNLLHSGVVFDFMGADNFGLTNTERALIGIIGTLLGTLLAVAGVFHCKRAKVYKRCNVGWIFWAVCLCVWFLALYNVLASKFGEKGSRYWIFFVIFVLPFYSYERFTHHKQWATPVTLYNFTLMGDKVLTLSLGKEAFPQHNYKEGEYAYIYCPSVSWLDKHPFTICSAPFEPYVQFSMRVSDNKAAWTRRVRDFLKQFNPSGKPFCELFSHTTTGVKRGKIMGPNGKPFFMLYGPCAAPTRHIDQYDEVMICASGIGVTPLASTMKSIVFDKWPRGIGRCFPDRAHFFWVCSHRDVDSFRWFIRTIKEADDQINNYLRTAQGNDFGPLGKMFKVHIFVTSYRKPADTKVANLPDKDNDEAFWGRRRAIDEEGQDQIDYGHVMRSTESTYTEMDLYNAINNPDQAGVSFGRKGAERVHVHFDRPKWDQYFEEISRESTINRIGVTFCGHPAIGAAIEKACAKHTSKSRGAKTFALHSEVF